MRTALVLVLAATYGCGSNNFEDCEASRSCTEADPTAGGSGGSANSGGTGGSGDSGGKSSTSSDAGGTGNETSSGASSGSASGGATDMEPDAGAAGMPALPGTCSVAADCDDGKLCNGIELCVDGACQYGTQPCPNAEPDHCDIACEEGSFRGSAGR